MNRLKKQSLIGIIGSNVAINLSEINEKGHFDGLIQKILASKSRENPNESRDKKNL